MMTGIKEKKIQIYTEIYCLLKYFPNSFIEKLPNKLLEIVSLSADRKYLIDIDTDKSINAQNISEKTKKVLAVLYYNYWSNEAEKRDIIEHFNENEKKYQEELRIKYNPDNLFNNKITKEEKIENSTSMMEYKESIFSKIKNWFKRTF